MEEELRNRLEIEEEKIKNRRKEMDDLFWERIKIKKKIPKKTAKRFFKGGDYDDVPKQEESMDRKRRNSERENPEINPRKIYHSPDHGSGILSLTMHLNGKMKSISNKGNSDKFAKTPKTPPTFKALGSPTS